MNQHLKQHQSQPSAESNSVQGVALSTGISYTVGEYLEGEDEQIREISIDTNPSARMIAVWVRMENYLQYLEHFGEFTIYY